MTGGMVGARASSMIQDGEDRIGSRNARGCVGNGIEGGRRHPALSRIAGHRRKEVAPLRVPSRHDASYASMGLERRGTGAISVSHRREYVSSAEGHRRKNTEKRLVRDRRK